MINKDIDIAKEYREYINKNKERWVFANDILYKMCVNNPKHENEEVIAGKVLIIGRTYAAAIERRKQKGEKMENDDFYYMKVAPEIKNCFENNELDDRLFKLEKEKKSIKNNVEEIIKIHKLFVDSCDSITKHKNRSLASKYLHFHCPSKFFIFDSIVSKEINKIISRPNKEYIKGINFEFDREYANFVCKMIELQEYLQGECEKNKYEFSPRKLDSFLIFRSLNKKEEE